MNYIVVGNSAAGLFAVEEIRRHDKRSELIVLTAEQEPSYSRCLTTYFLAGDIPVSQLYLRNADFAERLNLKIVYGVKVNWIDPTHQIVRSADGREWHYSKLLLAMGSSAHKPSIPGGNLPEVFTLRTMEDALAINKVLEQGAQKAVVIGGGLVSLKSAYALKKRGLEVTVVVSSRQILSQMLDLKEANFIQEYLRVNGLKFLLQTEALSIIGESHVQGVLIAPQTELAADMVIIGKGVRPNIENLSEFGFNIGQGLQVDSSLATNLPNIYAAGDIAETWDFVPPEVHGECHLAKCYDSRQNCRSKYVREKRDLSRIPWLKLCRLFWPLGNVRRNHEISRHQGTGKLGARRKSEKWWETSRSIVS